ncbi:MULTISPECIES: adenine deaminase [Bacillus]|uniref:adenine deaminase n=1 Tax=Bacillus TaxID=1386 RepID=UPI0002FFFD86|nr:MULTISPECIES: adenine deaminase [Bacillus]
MKTPSQLKTLIQASRGTILPELVIKNVKIVNLFTDEIEQADVAIHKGKFVGIGVYQGSKELDGSHYTMVPGLIDAHVHIESSMLSPSQFQKAVLPRGITTIVTDPHEIANVTGAHGIRWMLNDSKGCMLNYRYQLPSCVPATSFEDNGAILTAEDLEPFYKDELVLGLAEVMDYPAVLSGREDIMAKIEAAIRNDVPIDGHGAGLSGKDIDAYLTAGITTDHECVKPEEMIERVRRGMYVMLREGSAARNLHSLLKGYRKEISHRLMFCTDDKHIDDLLEEGSIDYHVRECLKAGIDLYSVLRMASLNTAQCYNLKGKGAIAPGYDADFILLNDIETFDIESVWVGGIQYEEKNSKDKVEHFENTVFLGKYQKELLQLNLTNEWARVIEIIPNSIVTKNAEYKVPVENGLFVSDISQDFVKIAVIERHKGTGSVGVGIVKGFQLQSGAVATTIAHDSHNIICIGTNDEDMDIAIRELERIGGGIAIANKGETVASLSLPVAGLMTTVSPQKLNENYSDLLVALNQLGITTKFSPLLTLSFLALPVIPSLKLTNQGLFNVDTFSFVSVSVD